MNDLEKLRALIHGPVNPEVVAEVVVLWLHNEDEGFRAVARDYISPWMSAVLGSVDLMQDLYGLMGGGSAGILGLEKDSGRAAIECAKKLGPSEATRRIACFTSLGAYDYAVVEGPHEDTRKAVLEDPQNAYWYARSVDEESRDDTREAAVGTPEFACCYAEEVDQGPHDLTRTAACEDPAWAMYYAREIDQGPHDETRAAACRDAHHAFSYASLIDKCPRDDTRAAAFADPDWNVCYRAFEHSYRG